MIRGHRLSSVVACGLLALAPAPQAFGQWLEQSFELKEGWNSIFLEVDPAPSDSDTLFGGSTIEAVWLRASASTAAVVPTGCGPNDVGPECAPVFDPLWRVWVPEDDPNRPAIDLRTIIGNNVYFIKASAPAVLTITGKPSPKVQEWETGYNLIGFHVDYSAPPTIDAYLTPSAAHSDARIFEKSPDGSLVEIAEPTTTTITAGEGYWVKSSASSDYDGPLKIDTLSLVGVDFGRRITEHGLKLENLATSQRNVTVTYTASAAVPPLPDDLPINAGDVPILWEKIDPEAQVGNLLSWLSLVDNPYSLLMSPTENAGSIHTITLAVDRDAAGQLATLSKEDDGVSSTYQGLLAINDGHGFRRLIPTATQVPPQTGGDKSGNSGVATGLWVGHVTVNKVAWSTANAETWANPDALTCGCENGVCQNTRDGLTDGLDCSGDPSICECDGPEMIPATDGDTSTLRPTSSEFVFPIIVHMADDGTVTLLTEVTMKFEPDQPGSDTGQFVLVTPACGDACDNLEDTENKNGQPFSRRVSTAGYAFDGDNDLPMAVTGTLGDDGSKLTAVIVLPPNGPLNPFKHSFHPDHDCDQIGECYKVTRAMEFAFSSTPPEGEEDPGYGFNLVAGEFLETLTIASRPSSAIACGCDDGNWCVGGVNDGDLCDNDAGCQGGGICTPTTLCVGGGPNEGHYCTDDATCNCPPSSCFCDQATGTCTGGVNAGATCYDDNHCGCGDDRLYATQAGGTFRLSHVSGISQLNNVSGN